MSATDEANGAAIQMATMLRQAEAEQPHPISLSSVTCTKTSADPAFLQGQVGDRLDCIATYAGGVQARWCAAFDPHYRGQLITYYGGAQMCEGPADARLTFP